MGFRSIYINCLPKMQSKCSLDAIKVEFWFSWENDMDGAATMFIIRWLRRIYFEWWVFYAGNLRNFLKLGQCYEIRFLSSKGLLEEARLLLTRELFLSLWYATRMMFLACSHIPVPSCLGVVFCIIKCLKGLLISNFARMVSVLISAWNPLIS